MFKWINEMESLGRGIVSHITQNLVQKATEHIDKKKVDLPKTTTDKKISKLGI